MTILHGRPHDAKQAADHGETFSLKEPLYMASHYAGPLVAKESPRVLRIDDLGASSKRYERHASKWWPYRELHSTELDALHRWLQRTGNRATLAITACWVERDGRLTRFDVKFPTQTAAIRRMMDKRLVEIACHGLTHCIPGRHAGWALNNRRWHREFTDDLPVAMQQAHLVHAKEFLETAFDCDVTTLVPPGNAMSYSMIQYARRAGFLVVTRRGDMSPFVFDYPLIRDDYDDVVLHDRALIGWQRMERVLARLGGRRFVTVREGAR